MHACVCVSERVCVCLCGGAWVRGFEWISASIFM